MTMHASMTRMTMQTASNDVAQVVQGLLSEQERSGRWVARKLGKSPAWVQRRLSGEVEMSSGDLQQFAQLLGVPVGSLFGDASQSTPSSAVSPQDVPPADEGVSSFPTSTHEQLPATG